MTNAELLAKIKTEIERLIKLHDSLASNAESEMIANLEIGAAQALDDILPFLSTLESEKPIIPNDLEEAAKEYAYKGIPDKLKQQVKPIADEISKNFIAGAKWQKEKLMKEAVEGKIYGYDDGSYELIASWLDLPKGGIYKDGDKVRVIVLPKEEQK